MEVDCYFHDVYNYFKPVVVVLYVAVFFHDAQVEDTVVCKRGVGEGCSDEVKEGSV